MNGMCRPMSTRDHLLTHLKEGKGNWVSGEFLGRSLMISRAAIWKHICTLKEEGYIIDSSRKKGYLLRQATESLLPQEIQEGLKTNFIGRNNVVYFKETDSTNTRAEHLANEGAPEGTVVIADTQTQGRGRRGRSWFSPPGAGIYASLILRPRLAPNEAPKLTLMTSVAAVETLRAFTALAVTIKWPNDVLIHEKKVAGILTEINAEMDKIHYVIIGIGMNINTPLKAFPGDIRKIATSLLIETGNRFSRVSILRDYLERFEKCYDEFANEGFNPLMSRWRALTDIIGKRISVDVIHSTYTGIVRDIDEDGFLILQDRDGNLKKIISGDIALLNHMKVS